MAKRTGRRATRRQPAARVHWPGKCYTTAEALAEDLGRFVAGEPIKARPVTRFVRLTRWCRRNPALASAAGLALVGILGVVGLGVAFVIHQAQAADDLRAEQGKTLEALAMPSSDAARRNGSISISAWTAA